jgi:hypothetical protein
MTGLLGFGEMLTLAERESGAYGLADEGLKARVAKVVDWANSAGPYTPDQLCGIRGQGAGRGGAHCPPSAIWC